MLKSCNYCRHRKKKCLTQTWASRCTECEHLDLACEFSRRQPSLKRRRNSQRIASKVSAAAAAADSASGLGTDRRWTSIGSIVSIVKDGDSQLNASGTARDPGQKILLKDDTPDIPQSAARTYWAYVHPLTPFVPSDMIPDDHEDWDPLLQQCVDQAAQIWLHHNPDPGLAQRVGPALNVATQGDLTLSGLAGVLLVMLRFPVEKEFIQRVSNPLSQLVSGSRLTANRSLALFTQLYSLAKNYQRQFLQAQSLPTPGID